VTGWLDVGGAGGYGVDNLPYGVDSTGHVVVAAGDSVVDLAALDGLDLDKAVWTSGSLNAFMALGPDAWQRTRSQLQSLLGPGSRPQPHAVRARRGVELRLPWEVADYVDFYASEHHVTNMGRILRPGEDPLPPAWRHLPMGYHGRAGTVVVSGSAVPRPSGILPGADGTVTFGPCARLDCEVELGFVIGAGSERGRRVPAADLNRHVFGVVVLNDWSARDIQAFEYRPLGPFLGKAFATSVSPWVVPLAALDRWRAAGPGQRPPPAPHLTVPDPRNYDVHLQLRVDGAVVSEMSAATMYWSISQQVAHLTSGGASLRTGDLLATGTISGPHPGSEGSLMEKGNNVWLADGQQVTIAGWCGTRGDEWLDLGEVTGTVVPAESTEAS
jgi:fumarylacetoacetase